MRLEIVGSRLPPDFHYCYVIGGFARQSIFFLTFIVRIWRSLFLHTSWFLNYWANCLFLLRRLSQINVTKSLSYFFIFVFGFSHFFSFFIFSTSLALICSFYFSSIFVAEFACWYSYSFGICGTGRLYFGRWFWLICLFVSYFPLVFVTEFACWCPYPFGIWGIGLAEFWTLLTEIFVVFFAKIVWLVGS